MNIKINLLLTGDEVMSGDIVDSNSAFIAQVFKGLGLSIHKKITVGDDIGLLCDAIEELSVSGDILIINGGLGPTVDDLTAQAVAKACRREIEQHPEALAHLDMWINQRNLTLNAANLKQTMLPADADIIANPIGTAVGFSVDHNNCYIACTPGVPRELFPMIENEIVPEIRKRFTLHDKTQVTRLCSFGVGESNLQQLIDNEVDIIPQGVELGFRASSESVEIKLTSRGEKDNTESDKLAARLKNELLPEHIFGKNNDTLASVLVELLKTKGLQLTTAESCTGGQVAAAITGIAGSSNVFEAGYVSYSNRIKQQLLGVPQETLIEHGAVSEETVKAMLKGAITISGADIGIAISGIAGPDGGSEEKPVGTAWIAWGFADNIKTAKYFWPRDRKGFQALITRVCLDLLRRELLGFSTQDCHFISARKSQ